MFRYAFTPQDHKFKVGDKPHEPLTGGPAGEVMAINDVAGWIDLERGPSPLMACVATCNCADGPPVPDPNAQEHALLRIAEHVIAHGIDAPGPYRGRARPAVAQGRTPGAPEFAESYLAIQGPPGSGKTTKGAELIVGLVRDGQARGDHRQQPRGDRQPVESRRQARRR